MNFNPMMQMQQQIKANHEEVRDFFSDLNDWEKKISAKDQALKEGRLPQGTTQPVRQGGFVDLIPSGVESSDAAKQHRAQMEKGSSSVRVKPGAESSNDDLAAIKPKNYMEYRQWDKVDVDSMLDDLDHQSKEEDEQRQRDRWEAERAELRAKEEARLAAVSEAQQLKNEGNAFLTQGANAKAAELYERAANMDPECAVHVANLAEARLRLEDWTGAEEAATKALTIDRRHVKSLFRRAKARVSLSKAKEAKEDLKKCIHLDPKNASARELLRALTSPSATASKSLPKSSEASPETQPTNTASANAVPVPEDPRLAARQAIERKHAEALEQAKQLKAEHDRRAAQSKPAKPKDTAFALRLEKKPGTRLAVQEVGSSDSEDEEEEGTVSQTATSAVTSEETGSPSAVKTSSAPSAPKTNIVVTKDNLDKLKETASKLVASQAHPVPTKWFEVERGWRSLRNRPDDWLAYLRSFPLDNFNAIFGASLSVEVLQDIAAALLKCCDEESLVKWAGDFKAALEKLPRFNTLTLLLTGQGRADWRALEAKISA